MNDVTEAFKVIRQAMATDESYAHSWHFNIAMMCYDAIMSDNEESGGLADDTLRHERAHKIGNDAASRFMKLCFDVDTSQ